MVILPGDDGKVHAFDSSDGSLLWTFDTGREAWSITPAIEYRNLIIFNTESTLYALHGNGSLAWKLGGGDTVPVAKDGIIYLKGWEGNMHAIKADGSDELWNASIDGGWITTPMLLDDSIVCLDVEVNTDNDGYKIVALDFGGRSFGRKT